MNWKCMCGKKYFIWDFQGLISTLLIFFLAALNTQGNILEA